MRISPTIRWSIVLVAAMLWAGTTVRADEKTDRFEQAKHLLAKGDFDAAIGRLDAAIRLEPKQANCRGLAVLPGYAKGTTPAASPI